MDAGGLSFLSLSSLAAAAAEIHSATTAADAVTIADADANLIFPKTPARKEASVPEFFY